MLERDRDVNVLWRGTRFPRICAAAYHGLPPATRVVLGGPCAAEMLSRKGKTDEQQESGHGKSEIKKERKRGGPYWVLGVPFVAPGMWPMSLSASCNGRDRGDHTNR
ncbi:hypothetical protein K0M31_003677 [Melipona bicolor]|uniref:Uncharacterized protein n=1 Tax=Melipona bicolor TaxID=60889 RepID=A0AA40FXP4_9HYME|nr:hypothetical protein K0M31_003677 [Melipona bicolor]